MASKKQDCHAKQEGATMQVNIVKDRVLIQDEDGNTVHCSAEQLLDLAHIVQSVSREDGGIIFNVLEFNV